MLLTGCITNLQTACNQYQDFKSVAQCTRGKVTAGNDDNDYILAKTSVLEEQLTSGKISNAEAKLTYTEMLRGIDQKNIDTMAYLKSIQYVPKKKP